MAESWELTAEERAALPAWARRGLIPHRPELNGLGKQVCEECGQPWHDGGCEVVVLTLALARSALALEISQYSADGWSKLAGEAIEYQGELKRRAEAAEQDAATLRSVLGAVSSFLAGASPSIAGQS